MTAALAGAFALSRYDVLSDESIRWLLPATLFVAEAGLSVLMYRELKELRGDSRKGAFAFVSRTGLHYVGTLFLNILGFFLADHAGLL